MEWASAEKEFKDTFDELLREMDPTEGLTNLDEV